MIFFVEFLVISDSIQALQCIDANHEVIMQYRSMSMQREDLFLRSTIFFDKFITVSIDI